MFNSGHEMNVQADNRFNAVCQAMVRYAFVEDTLRDKIRPNKLYWVRKLTPRDLLDQGRITDSLLLDLGS